MIIVYVTSVVAYIIEFPKNTVILIYILYNSLFRLETYIFRFGTQFFVAFDVRFWNHTHVLFCLILLHRRRTPRCRCVMAKKTSLLFIIFLFFLIFLVLVVKFNFDFYIITNSFKYFYIFTYSYRIVCSIKIDGD